MGAGPGGKAARAPEPAWHGEWAAGDVKVLGLWVALYLLCYLGGRRLLGAKSPRRVWILTLANAVMASALGVPVALDLETRGWALADVAGDSAYSRLALLSFLGYLLTDLVVGVVEYRHQVTLVMGWMHHVGYSTLTAHFLYRGISNSYASFLLEEVPTACLAAGRLGLLDMGTANLLFALSYVPTRFVFHLYVMHRLFGPVGAAPRGTPLHVYVYPSYLGLALNAYWLYAWVCSALRRYRQRKVLRAFPGKRRVRLASLIRRKASRAHHTLLRGFGRRASGGSGRRDSALPAAAPPAHPEHSPSSEGAGGAPLSGEEGPPGSPEGGGGGGGGGGGERGGRGTSPRAGGRGHAADGEILGGLRERAGRDGGGRKRKSGRAVPTVTPAPTPRWRRLLRLGPREGQKEI